MLTELRQELTRTAKEIGRKTGPIFIVEDDKDDQLLLWREVKFLFGDVPVQTFSNGAQLMDYLSDKEKTDPQDKQKQKPRLILLDLNMPRMDGFKTMDKLQGRAVTKDVPVVVVSGTRKNEDMEKAKKGGAHAFLSKPFSRDSWVFF